MHILFLDFDDIKNPLLGAGQAKATLEVGSRMAKKGHRVTVICSSYPGSRDRTEHGITYRHIGIGTNSIHLNNVLYIFSVPLALLSAKADVIIECFTSPMSTLMSPLFTRIPVIALPTSFAADRHSKLYHLPFTVIEKFGARFYKYFMPYTQAYLDKMRAYNPHIDARIIPEGVEKRFFSIRQKEPKYILFLGRIDIDQKGIDLLLAAYAKIPHKTYPLVIAGKGSGEQTLHELIKRYDLTRHVSFIGPAFGEKKDALLSSALYVVMPSRNEGFALFSLEALAAGIPLVVFDIPGFSWAKNTKAVVKAPAFDVDAYAKNMQRMMHPAFLRASRSAAKPTARPYTWDAVCDAFLSYCTYVITKERKIV